MWETLVRPPRGRLSARKFIVLLATLLVAVFSYIFLAPTAHAAEASWSNGAIVYEGKTYSGPEKSQAGDGLGLPADSSYYTYTEPVSGNGNTQKAYVIYFAPGADPPKETSATYATYSLKNGVYSSKSGTKNISLEAQAVSGGGSNSSCELDGIGWIVCPVSRAIAEAMDYLYDIVGSVFFKVAPLTTAQGSLYQMWDVFRNAANVLFVIGFLIMIYGQISGNMLSNYTIKKLLPRLIISAILVNVSYWICAIAVDISNILGFAVADMFSNLRDIGGGPNTDADTGLPTWANVTAAVLAGGSLAVAGGAALVIASGTGMGVFFLLLGAMLPAIFAILVAVAILAARQALITVFIILAPLAFVAYLLPNTDEWFTRWRKAFTTMLVMFPAFSVIFGGAQLAGTVIIQNAPSGRSGIIVVILGLTVQIVPLFITPFLIKLSSGLMATIANITNDRSKGVFDRTKNWANTRRDQEQALGRMRRDQHAKARGYVDGRRPSRTRTGRALSRVANPYDRAYYKDYKRREREGLKGANEAMSEGLFSQTAAGGRIHDRTKDAGLEKHFGEAANSRRWNAAVYGNPRTGAGADPYRSHLHHAAHMESGEAKLIEDRATAHAERDLQTSINANAALRGLKIGTDVDAAHAKLQAANVEAEGKQTFQNEVMGDRALRLMNVQTVAFEKEAATIESTLQKRAEAHWERITSDASDPQFDRALRNMRLQEVEASESHKKAEAQWNKLVENIRSEGKNAPDIILNDDKMVAGKIQRLGEDIINEEKATQAIKAVSQSKGEQQFLESREGRKLNIRAQAAKDALESTQIEEAALVQEWRTEEGSQGLTGDDALIASELRDADVQKRTQTQRTNAAKRVSDVEYAKQVQDDATGLAVEAGGIEGVAGVSQAKAVAFQTIVDSFVKGVAAEKTPLSRTDNDELLGDTFLGASDILDQPTERIAAIGGTIAGRFHQMSHIKLWSRMGELHAQAATELEQAKRSGNQAAIDVAEEKLGKVKDLQQQVMGDKKKIPFGIGDKDQGDAGVGEYGNDVYETTRMRISTHMSGQKLAGMDPDDIRLIFEMARAGKLSRAEIKKINQAYTDWKEDSNLKTSLEDKHRVLLDPIMEDADSNGGVRNYPQSSDPNALWGIRYNAVNSMSDPSDS